MELARKKARRLALPVHKKEGVDSKRGGRIGDDFEADEQFLRVDMYNRSRLMRLFDESVIEHRWIDAAGIISAILRSLSWWSKYRPSHLFPMGMEVLRRLEPGEAHQGKLRRFFNLMYNKQPSGKKIDAQRSQGQVEVHLALYLYYSGDCLGAYNVLRPIADGPALRDDATCNLIYSLVLHRMWYDQVSTELHVSDEQATSGDSYGSWHPQCTEDAGNFTGAVQMDIPSAIKDADGGSQDANNSRSMEVSMDNIVRHVAVTSRNKKRKKRQDPDDEFWANATVHVRPIMDRRLYPVQILYEQPSVEYLVPLTSQSKDFHDKAVEHLRRAIALSPDITTPLIPLVQLLLAIGDVEGANKEIEICYQATHHITPLSLRALLLESLSERDADILSNCYEEILKQSPSSVDAINGLIALHDNGEYETQSLVEAIAGHLDTQAGSIHVWHTLADCFLEISSCIQEEDETCDISSEDLVFTFLDRTSPWKHRHFPDNLLTSADPTNRWRLVAYKAACAAHIYGPQFEYVKRALHILQMLKKKRSFDLVQTHCQKSLSILGV